MRETCIDLIFASTKNVCMPEKLSPSDFLRMRHSGVVIDVRTPAEFEQGHIPGAVNLPLFSNEERVVIGTLYKKTGKEAAVERGLEFVGPKMATMVRQAKTLSHGQPLFVHCWRGGMRSASVVWLLETAGMTCFLLKDGYKGYRAEFETLLTQKRYQFIVLGGPTGSGKTSILNELSRLNEQVLDLEGMAHHKGSAFGALGQLSQPTNEQFENDIHESLLAFDSNKRIWVEGESKTIGKNFIPPKLFPLLEAADIVDIDIPLEARLDRLVAEYASFSNEQLIESFLKIRKRLGDLCTRQAIDLVEQQNHREAARIALQYYDKSYSHTLSQRKGRHALLQCSADTPNTTAQRLIKLINGK